MVYRLVAIPFTSRSLIACWYSSFSDLHFRALERLSMELWRIVSSMRVTSSSSTSTMSGRAEVTRVFSGMEDIGLSFACIPGWCAHSIISLPRCCWMPLTKLKGHYHTPRSQDDVHTALYRYRGVPGCLLQS